MIGLFHLMRSLKTGLLAALLIVTACRAATSVQVNNHPGILNGNLWEKSRDASILAEKAGDKQEKARLAGIGIAYAEECIMRSPEDAACYYYRAINTGIYYSAHIKGYQEGLKGMIQDCKKVITLDDKLDHGGAYRTIGKIYTDVPETTLSKNGISRDLNLAVEYLQKAVQIDGGYPENHIYLAEALLESGKREEAIFSLANAVSLTPHWKNHRDYALWQKMNKELSKKLK